MNNWNIPARLEIEVRKRDQQCVYYWVSFNQLVKKQSATWEHIINDARIITQGNIALCCCSCNASKWAKDLLIWLTSNYCKNKNITIDTVAPIIKKATQELVIK